MRIGFDARMIDHPGIGRYISNLLKAMLELNSKHEFFLFGSKAKLSAFNLRLSAENFIEWNPPVYSLQEQVAPYEKYNIDIVHVPNFNVPFNIGKGRGTGKLVVTIHDLIYTKFPEYLPSSKRKIARFLIKNAIKKAGKIIAVSNNTKKDIIDFNPTVREKIEVVHESVDPVFQRIDDQSKLRPVKEKYKLPDRFLLFVGSLRRHKNITRLLEAYKILKEDKISHKLVIIGRYDPKEPKILESIENADAAYLGEVPTEDLVIIYNLSSLFILPSLYEGFGLPILEAFACGLPVVASGVSSIPEVIDNPDALFDPNDARDIANVMRKILENEGLGLELINKGVNRLGFFSWKRAAENTLNVYNQLYADKRK